MNVQIVPAAFAGEEVEWLGGRYRIAVAGAAAAGRAGAFTAVVPPGFGPALHVHRREDELVHLVEGEADFWLDGRVTRLGAGQSAFLPRQVPHCFRVTGAGPARFHTVVSPGGFEGFFAGLVAGGHGPHDQPALAAFAAGYGVEFLGPSPL